MGKINILGFDVANLIAAGEVVDRPASVVKELLENAVDAGGTSITIEIKHGGITFIRVTDNGCGISYDDLPVALLRHATSKIAVADDLEKIMTLGFRGEALAAIASVSKIKIFSKVPENPLGSLLEADGGEIKTITETGCPDGTSVVVENLFYNVPARRKFLKKDSTEAAAVSAVVEKIALSRPDISLKYICDGEIKFITSGKGELSESIWALFGKETADRTLKVDREENGIRISGFVSEPDLCRSNRNMENFFINGRYIKSKTASAALEQAYVSKIPQDKFPFCILNIELNPSTVDVNVHPAKLEVKFANEKLIFDAVYYAVKGALEAVPIRPELKLPNVQPSTNFPKSADIAAKVTAEEYKNTLVPLDTRREKAKQLKLDTISISDQPYPSRHASPAPSVREAVPAHTESTFARYAPPPLEPDETEPIPLAEMIELHRAAMESVHLTDPAESNHPSQTHDKTESPVPSPFMPSSKNETPSHTDTSVNIPVTDAPQIPTEQASLNESPVLSTDIDPAEIPEYFIIGEAFNCYVIVQLEDRILLIDKHAAHERILFDELCRKMRDAGGGSIVRSGQILMAPLVCHLLVGELDALDEYKDKLRALGFEYTADEHGVSTYDVKISTIPSDLNADEALELFTTLATKLSDVTASVESAAEEFFESRLWQAACKAAIKGGRIYNIAHIKWICDRLLVKPDKNNQVIRTCPHGRPVAFEIKKTAIDRQFARLM